MKKRLVLVSVLLATVGVTACGDDAPKGQRDRGVSE